MKMLMQVDPAFVPSFIAEQAGSSTCFFDEQHVVWLQGKYLSFLHQLQGGGSAEKDSLITVDERSSWFAKCSLSYFGIASLTEPTISNRVFHADCLRRCGNLDDAEVALALLRNE